MKTTHAVLGGAALIAVSVLGSAYIIVQKIESVDTRIFGVGEELEKIRWGVEEIERLIKDR